MKTDPRSTNLTLKLNIQQLRWVEYFGIYVFHRKKEKKLGIYKSMLMFYIRQYVNFLKTNATEGACVR